MCTKSVKTAQNSLYLNILWHIFFIDIRELKEGGKNRLVAIMAKRNRKEKYYSPLNTLIGFTHEIISFDPAIHNFTQLNDK